VVKGRVIRRVNRVAFRSNFIRSFLCGVKIEGCTLPASGGLYKLDRGSPNLRMLMPRVRLGSGDACCSAQSERQLTGKEAWMAETPESLLVTPKKNHKGLPIES